MKKVVLLISVLFLLSSCGTTLKGWEYTKAEEECSTHQGVDHIYDVGIFTFNPYLTCRDGFTTYILPCKNNKRRAL